MMPRPPLTLTVTLSAPPLAVKLLTLTTGAAGLPCVPRSKFNVLAPRLNVPAVSDAFGPRHTTPSSALSATSTLAPLV